MRGVTGGFHPPREVETSVSGEEEHCEVVESCMRVHVCEARGRQNSPKKTITPFGRLELEAGAGVV